MITILIWYGQKLLSLPVVFDLAGSLNDACGRGDITKSVHLGVFKLILTVSGCFGD
jgi:hypothetical protein